MSNPALPSHDPLHAALKYSLLTQHLVMVGADTWGTDTRAHAAWLARNLVPTREQMALYGGRCDAAELPADGIARSGADIVVAECIALYDPLHRVAALAVLRRAAEAGSTYALQGLARVFDATSADRLEPEAYYRASLLRGDWLAGLRPTPELSIEDNFAADMRAYRILRQIDRARRARGLPPLPFDPRPGLERAIERCTGTALPHADDP